MTVASDTFNYSLAKNWTQQNFKDAFKAITLLARNQARIVLSALSPTAITNNTGGSTAGPIVAVPTAQTIGMGLAGLAYAPRAGFNTSIGQIDNALQTLASYLNTNLFTPLASPIAFVVNSTGTVTPNTPAAITSALTGIDGAADQATGSLTLTTAAPANGDTVTVNGKVYTFQTVLTNVDGNVLIGASLTTAAANLFNAINLGAGSGTTYAAAMTLHPTISATNPSAGVVNFTAKTGGTAGNSLTLARTFATGANATLSGATLTGGAQDNTALRSEVNAAISAARNNLSTLIKGYNIGLCMVGVTQEVDASAGKADTNLGMVNQPTAPTTVTSATLAANDVAVLTDVNSALLALANDISYIANRIGTNLLLVAAGLNVRQNVLIVP